MDRRSFATSLLGALTTPSGIQDGCEAQPAIAPGAVQIDVLFSGNIGRGQWQGQDIAMRRVTFGPGATLDIAIPGLVVVAIDEGNLSFPIYADHTKLGVHLRGQGLNPPPLQTDRNGMTSIPTGSSVVADRGGAFPVQNTTDDHAVAYILTILNLPWEHESSSSTGTRDTP